MPYAAKATPPPMALLWVGVAEKLIAAGLVREIKARIGTPVWRRDDETAQSFALKLTAAGLKAIAVDDGAIEEEPSEPAHASSEAQREVAPAGALADQGVITRNLNVGGGPGGHSQRLRESEAPSAPRSGSKAAEIVDLLQRDQGATIDELIEATGWLPHTTRAALTGRGLRRKCDLEEPWLSRGFAMSRHSRERVSNAVSGSAKPRVLRCAIYTRVSTDQGLEQDFNSLDAQHVVRHGFETRGCACSGGQG